MGASGDGSQGLLAAGQPLACVDWIEPLADIVKRFENDMRQALARGEIN